MNIITMHVYIKVISSCPQLATERKAMEKRLLASLMNRSAFLKEAHEKSINITLMNRGAFLKESHEKSASILLSL